MAEAHLLPGRKAWVREGRKEEEEGWRYDTHILSFIICSLYTTHKFRAAF